MFLAINWSNALVVTVVGFLLVFVVLVLLIVIITLFGKVMAPTVKVPKKSTADELAQPVVDQETEDRHISADESAAIAMALYLTYAEVHDEESHVITIKKVERRYSPWSSKIYGINNLVR